MNTLNRFKAGRAAAALGMAASLFWGTGAWAGVFHIPHFVEPGRFALGFEPELTLTNSAGIGANVSYTHGLNDLMNAMVVVGTGSGDRKFRLGAKTSFDFFPDIEGQPGIGLAASGIYYRLADAGQFELTAIPYIHKTFFSGGNEVEPFFALPLGMGFSEGRYRALSSVVIGSTFKSTPSLRYILEFGIAVNNTDTYISGGVAYSP